MAAGRPKSIVDSKVFDVAKPGKSKPMGTSRPVIISHAAPIKDATVINVNGTEEVPAQMSAPSVTRKVISPISTGAAAKPETKPTITVISDTDKPELATAPLVAEAKVEEPVADIPEETVKSEADDSPKDSPAAETETAKADEAEASAEAEKSVEEKPETPVTDEGTEPAPEAETKKAGPEEESNTDDTTETEEKSDESTGSEAASVDALAEASGKSKEDAKKAEEDAKKEAALQEMIASKKYFVPLAHDSSQKKGSSRALVVLLILIILVAGAYLAIDAEVIKTSIKLPFQFFK